MQRVPRYLKCFQSIVDAYGYWPTFHDSPVCRFHVETDAITLEVEAWEISSEVDARGYFILTKQHEIGFRFSGIVSSELSNFIPGNILHGLIFSSEEEFSSQGHFSVNLESAMGSDLSGRFLAKWGEVSFVRPLDQA